MYSKTITTTLEGLTGFLVEVESNISRGLPNFNIIGLPDTSIKEAKDRVRSCISYCGLKMPVGRITINLAPANIRKEGSQIDLAIALSLLKSMGAVRAEASSEYAAIGELSLDARVIGVVGALPMVISLRENQVKNVIIPYDNLEECSLIEDIDLIPVRTLKDAVNYINGDITRQDLLIKTEEKAAMCRDLNAIKDSTNVRTTKEFSDQKNGEALDFSDIKGQDFLKRALMISAAGGHNILMVGSPGSGKPCQQRDIRQFFRI